nr:MAG TPA: hypothetical protein [Caudoviricetes sp.]
MPSFLIYLLQPHPELYYLAILCSLHNPPQKLTSSSNLYASSS